jgi:hypothetical protein
MNTLLIIAAVLFVMWICGFALHFAGGLIHILLVLAIVAVLVRVITGRNVL